MAKPTIPLWMIDGNPELKGFNPDQKLKAYGPTFRAAALICTKDGSELAATATRLHADEETALSLLDDLVEAQAYLKSLNEMVAVAEVRLLLALDQN